MSHVGVGLLTEERLAAIRALVGEHGSVRVGDLVRRLGASRETVRRDLAELERLGALRRVHGGAVAAGQRGALEPLFSTRKVSMLAEKRAIAAATTALVAEGESVYLDLGTTVLEVARQLAGRRLTLITNSVPAALAALHTPGSTVVLLGGTLRPGDRAVSGAETLRGLGAYYVDKAILGAGGLSVTTGLTDYHIEEAAVRREAIARAHQTVVASDHTKFGLTGVAAVCPIDRVGHVVTDWGVDPADLEALQTAGVAVTVAPAPDVNP